MGLKEENARLLRQVGQLEGALESTQKELAELKAFIERRNGEYESLLRQTGELNEVAVKLNRESDLLRYKIPKLEEQIATLLDQNSKLLEGSERHSESNRDLAAAIKAVLQK